MIAWPQNTILVYSDEGLTAMPTDGEDRRALAEAVMADAREGHVSTMYPYDYDGYTVQGPVATEEWTGETLLIDVTVNTPDGESVLFSGIYYADSQAEHTQAWYRAFLEKNG